VADAAERNVISGNAWDGVTIQDAGTQNNVVAGNYIGTNAPGTAALGNAGNGIAIYSSGNTIGGLAAGARNVVAGNGQSGIYVGGTGAAGNQVEGNYIGTNAAGTVLRNGRGGVSLFSGAHNNAIGGTAAGAGNTIAFNGGAGIIIGASASDASTVSNWIRGNSIHDNAGLGIDLGYDGVTPNGAAPRTGPNKLQNYPQLSSVQGGSTSRVTGTLNALPNTTYTLDFYASAASDPSSFGQGQRYLGSGQATTDASGNVTFDSATFASALGASNPGEVITATATDPAGNTSEFSSFLTAGGPYTLLEGASLTLRASYFAIPGGNPVNYAWDVNGDGTFGDATGSSPTLSWGQLVALGIADGPATFHVRVRVTDAHGNTATSVPIPLQLNNVAPTASLSGPSDGVPGQPRTFTFAATDPSPIDQAAGFTYTIDWGDGTPVQTTSGNGTGVSVDHIYTGTGPFTVHVRATDKDGGTSPTPATQGITVTTVALETDPGDATRTALAVGGTTGDDVITLSATKTPGSITVKVNNSSFGPFTPTGHLFVYGQAGVDQISLVNKNTVYITVPAFLYGGDGNDTLDASGSTASNVLSGDAGIDILQGGLGRDLLIGGTGADKLKAVNGGESILIGGTTDYDLGNTALTYDRKLAALFAILAEWGRTDEAYAQRIANLQNSSVNTGSGTVLPNGTYGGTYFLNGATVHDDGVLDTLTGSQTSLDWFFAGPQESPNRRNGDVVTPIV
jgi:hypothetical protein